MFLIFHIINVIPNWQTEMYIKLEAVPPPMHVLAVSRYGSRSGTVIRIATKINRLFTGTLPAFPENFMQIHSEVFAHLLTNRQKTNNGDYITT